MSLTAASSVFVVLLTVTVIQGQTDWGVTYSSTQICALKGSTVDIVCSFRYPSRINDPDTRAEDTFWFTEGSNDDPEDLRTDSEYSGRVQYHCGENNCTLTITDLRESDSGVYKFRLTTNQEGGEYTGEPGVTLSVTVNPGLEVQVMNSKNYKGNVRATLTCHSRCHLPEHPPYIWFKNGQKSGTETRYFLENIHPSDSVSCALKGHEDFPSPSVCVSGQSCNRVTYTDRRICAFKGSSVDISCSYYSYNYHYSVESKLWFRPDRSRLPEDVSKDSQYSGRVQVLETEGGRSTLRITELRETDSAQYHFTFKTPSFEWRSSLPGTTLTVTALEVQVTRIIRVQQFYTEAELKCHSSCSPADRLSYVWFKNGWEIWSETLYLSENIHPSDSFSCALKGHEDFPSPSVYPPKLPSVSVSPSGQIVEGSSVTLTCSSDANPAAKYTWYKENQPLFNKEPQLVFNSIQSSDSGRYHCAAENELGRRTSENISINVKYAPKLPSVSVSPSGQILEGSSVNLTCSSDANPAAKYTWYKENQTLHQGPEGFYSFSSISSEDRGIYTCRSENQFGQINSTSLSLDVQYAPKLPSVSVSPSGQIVEGSSVNLTCSSDANPAAKYTWYKEDEDSPKASGQIFTITDFRPEHSGNYYCEAQNTRGRQRSTLNLTVGAVSWKSAATGSTTAVLLVLILLAVVLLIRRNKSFTQQRQREERPDNREQLNVAPSAAAQRPTAEQQDDLHYASISFSHNQTDVVYSNVRVHPHRETEEDEDGVEYSAVRFNNASSGPGTRCQEDGEVSFALYSTVNQNR